MGGHRPARRGRNFNSDSKPYDVRGAVTVAGDRLYAAFRTQDAEAAQELRRDPNAPFKTGGCLDLMIGTDAAADAKRASRSPATCACSSRR